MARLSLLYLQYIISIGGVHTKWILKWYQLNFECLLLPNQYFRFINASQHFMVSWHGGIPIVPPASFQSSTSPLPGSTTQFFSMAQLKITRTWPWNHQTIMENDDRDDHMMMIGLRFLWHLDFLTFPNLCLDNARLLRSDFNWEITKLGSIDLGYPRDYIFC